MLSLPLGSKFPLHHSTSLKASYSTLPCTVVQHLSSVQGNNEALKEEKTPEYRFINNLRGPAIRESRASLRS